MSLQDKLNKVEVNQEGKHVPENTFKVDDKVIEGVRNVKIEYGVDFGYPVVTVEFYAKIEGKIKKAHVIKK